MVSQLNRGGQGAANGDHRLPMDIHTFYSIFFLQTLTFIFSTFHRIKILETSASTTAHFIRNIAYIVKCITLSQRQSIFGRITLIKAPFSMQVVFYCISGECAIIEIAYTLGNNTLKV